MKNPLKALEAIELLVSSIGEDLEFKLMKNEIKDPLYKAAAEMISKIYMISHSETKHSCSHENWEKIKYEILNDERRMA